MKLWLSNQWDRLRSSFWFVPAVMALSAAALAFLGVAVDQVVSQDWLRRQTWVYTGGAEGASVVLGTIAGSMITLTGVVFSMTLMTLSLASTQLGPRLLRNFMRDRMNQAVLGTFVATFVFCLLVLRTVRRADEVLFVPHISVTFGVLLALLALGVLIVFIHHISVSIQVDEVVARVGGDLEEAIDRMFPDEASGGRREAGASFSLPPDFETSGHPIDARADGYLQRVDTDALVELAAQHDLILRVTFVPGRYVVAGQPLVVAWPPDRTGEEVDRNLAGAFVLGSQRTAVQDVQFPFQQLVEIAVRALSPGVNDPYTAIACVDRLGSALSRLARRASLPVVHSDKAGRPRVIADVMSFAVIAETTLGELRQHAKSSPMVTLRVLESIGVVATATIEHADRVALLRAATSLNADAQAAIANADDRRRVELRYIEARRALGG